MSSAKSSKREDKDGLFFKFMHHFGDWQLETYYMSRVERSVYFDMKELYFHTGKPLTDNLPMLYRYLRCVSDEEKEALHFVLKDKFVHCPNRGCYKHHNWDMQIKNYRYRHHFANGIGNEYANDNTNAPQHTANANRPKSGAERVAKLKAQKQKMLVELSDVTDITPYKDKGITEIRTLYRNVFGTDYHDDETANANDNTNAPQHTANAGNDDKNFGNDDGNAKNPCYNQLTKEPINQLTKSERETPTPAKCNKTSKDKFDPVAFLIKNDVDEQTANAFVKYKKTKLKKGELITETMLVLIKNQAQKTGLIGLADALKIMMATGKWKSFEADWHWQAWYEAVLIQENRPIPDWLLQNTSNIKTAGTAGNGFDKLAVNQSFVNYDFEADAKALGIEFVNVNCAANTNTDDNPFVLNQNDLNFVGVQQW